MHEQIRSRLAKEKQREAQENVEDPYKEQQPNVADVVLNASSGNAKTDVEDGLDERFDMKDHGEKAKDSEKIKAIKAHCLSNITDNLPIMFCLPCG